MKSRCVRQRPMEPVTVIIPVKDEEDGLSYLLEDYHNSSFNGNSDVEFIFVIDNRTSDESESVAREFSELIIDQNETQGKGAAMKQAVEAWKSNRTPLVVFLDADGSYSFDSVKEVIDALVGGADVVSGSRFMVSKRRPEGIYVASVLNNLFFIFG